MLINIYHLNAGCSQILNSHEVVILKSLGNIDIDTLMFCCYLMKGGQGTSVLHLHGRYEPAGIK